MSNQSQVEQYGAYTHADAARLLKKSAPTITRWVEGYFYDVKGGIRRSPNVLQSSDGFKPILSFLDLIELGLIKGFRDAHVELSDICKVASKLRIDLGPHPLAHKELMVNGRAIVSRAAPGLVSELEGQRFFFYAEQFLRRVDYNIASLAETWQPNEHIAEVIVSARCAAGAPILRQYGIRTEMIAGMAKAANNPLKVARAYEISVGAVRAAVDFEKWRIAA